MTGVRLQIVTERASNMAQHLLKHASGENCSFVSQEHIPFVR